MRTLIRGSLLLISCCGVFAQDASKIEITYSLAPQEMYRTWCASCHGAAGKGDGPAASALKRAPADLTQLSKKNGGKFPGDRVRRYIEGKDDGDIKSHGSREMPIWGTVFQEIATSPAAVTYRVTTLANYVESLQAK